MRVHSWSGGSVRHIERIVRRDGAFRLRVLPARFGIIEHPNGPVVFDTGYHPSLRHRLQGPARAYHHIIPWRCEPHQTIGARLQALGYQPHDVQTVILSHLHADHIAGLVDLPGVRITLAQQALSALRAGRRIPLARHGYFAELLPRDLDERADLVILPEPTAHLEDCAVDLLGDDTLHLVALPGHAPGQMGLWVKRPETCDVLFLADASFSLDAIRTGATPSRLFMRAAFDDARRTRATIANIQSWKAKNPSMELVTCHGWEGPDGGEIQGANSDR